jgi:hypothetical protein
MANKFKKFRKYRYARLSYFALCWWKSRRCVMQQSVLCTSQTSSMAYSHRCISIHAWPEEPGVMIKPIRSKRRVKRTTYCARIYAAVLNWHCDTDLAISAEPKSIVGGGGGDVAAAQWKCSWNFFSHPWPNTIAHNVCVCSLDFCPCGRDAHTRGPLSRRFIYLCSKREREEFTGVLWHCARSRWAPLQYWIQITSPGYESFLRASLIT